MVSPFLSKPPQEKSAMKNNIDDISSLCTMYLPRDIIFHPMRAPLQE